MTLSMRSLLLSALFFSPVAALANPAIITTDVTTGIILSSNNIDIKQDPYLAGKIALLFIALNDAVTGDVDPDKLLSYPDGREVPFSLVMKDAASDSLTSPVSITLTASQIAQSPAILNERMNALFKLIGMRATKLETTRTGQGEPTWSGFTTNRDIARLVSSILLTHGAFARSLLPEDHKSLLNGRSNWLYREGICVAVSNAPETKREFVTVIRGASSEDNCANAVNVAVASNDLRIGKVIAEQKTISSRKN